MRKLTFTYLCCVLLLIICLIAITGWQFDLVLLRTVMPGAPAIPPLSIFIIIILSISLFFTARLISGEISRGWVWMSWFFAGVAVVAVVMASIDYVFDTNVKMGQFFFPELIERETENSGLPSPYTLICSLFISLCIILAPLEFNFRNRMIVVLMLMSWSIPYIILFDYAIVLNPLNIMHAVPNSSMALMTAVCLLLLCSGVLGLWPDDGVVGLMTSSSLGGLIVRLLLPAAIVIPLALSWFVLYSREQGLLGLNFEVAMNWGFTSLFMAGVIIVGGFLVHFRSEEKDKVLSYSKKGELKFKGLLESAPDAMVIVDKSGEIVLVNAQTERLFGYSRIEMIGNKVEMLMPERFVDVHNHHRTNYYDTPKVRMMGEGLELKGRRKNGEEFSIEISLSPIDTEEGLLVSAAIRDITETIKAKQRIEELNRNLEQKVAERTAELQQARDNLEDEVQKRTQQLQMSNKELEAFSYSISHDLRAPLRSISGYSSVLLEDYSEKFDDEGKRIINVVIKNAEKMGRLIDDILEFSRLSRVDLRKSKVNLSRIFQESYDSLRALEDSSRIINLQIDEVPNASGDPVLISQMVNNFLSNAIKYTRPREEGEIHVGYKVEEGENVYFIRDNGVGFDENYKNKLFGVFQRLHKESEFEGTGVGLAIVHRVIVRHGGKVWVESKVGEGTTFYFTLPE